MHWARRIVDWIGVKTGYFQMLRCGTESIPNPPVVTTDPDSIVANMNQSLRDLDRQQTSTSYIRAVAPMIAQYNTRHRRISIAGYHDEFPDEYLVDSVVCTLSHESLHHVVNRLEGAQASTALDAYLVETDGENTFVDQVQDRR